MQAIKKWQDLKSFEGKIIIFTHPRFDALEVSPYYKSSDKQNMYFGHVTLEPRVWFYKEGYQIKLIYYDEYDVTYKALHISDIYLQSNENNFNVRLPTKAELNQLAIDYKANNIKLGLNEDYDLEILSGQILNHYD